MVYFFYFKILKINIYNSYDIRVLQWLVSICGMVVIVYF